MTPPLRPFPAIVVVVVRQDAAPIQPHRLCLSSLSSRARLLAPRSVVVPRVCLAKLWRLWRVGQLPFASRHIRPVTQWAAFVLEVRVKVRGQWVHSWVHPSVRVFVPQLCSAASAALFLFAKSAVIYFYWHYICIYTYYCCCLLL